MFGDIVLFHIMTKNFSLKISVILTFLQFGVKYVH